MREHSEHALRQSSNEKRPVVGHDYAAGFKNQSPSNIGSGTGIHINQSRRRILNDFTMGPQRNATLERMVNRNLLDTLKVMPT